MLVKFDCDCIGLVGIQGLPEGHHVVIFACDEDRRIPAFFVRDMTGKEYTPLKDEKVLELIQEVQRYCNYGDRFLEIKALLGVSNP